MPTPDTAASECKASDRSSWWRSLSILPVSIIFCLLSGPEARSTNARLSDFAEIQRTEAEAMLPQLVSSFPNARFYLTGLTSPSVKWQFIRVEDSVACEGTICPMIVMHDRNEWKILIKADREIMVSTNLESGEFIQYNIKLKGGREVIIRYKAGEYLFYVD